METGTGQRSKRKKRLAVQVPSQKCLWGLQFRDGAYVKLVVSLRSSDAAGAAMVLAKFGSDMTFTGEIDPHVTSSLGDGDTGVGSGLAGRRNYSRMTCNIFTQPCRDSLFLTGIEFFGK